MADVFCVKHMDKQAVGYCSHCNKSYCADCLDVEMGRPICADCKKLKSNPPTTVPAPKKDMSISLDDLSFPPKPPKPTPSPVISPVSPSKAVAPSFDDWNNSMPKPEASTVPPTPKPVVPAAPSTGASPLNFKSKGLEDDPLGLFNAPVPKAALPKVETPRPSVPISAAPLTVTPPGIGEMSSPKPSLDLNAMGAPSKPTFDFDVMAAAPKPSPAPVSKPLAASFPKASSTAVSDSLYSSDSVILEAPASEKKAGGSRVKVSGEQILKRSHDLLDPLAKKLKVPTYVFLGGIVFVLLGLMIWGLTLIGQPSVSIAASIAPIHIVQVDASQVSEMDITTFSDLQNQLRSMGFSSMIQMTVPQLPSPNFFDVHFKSDVGTYAEILKMPGQIAPHLSFVTVFTNGVWYSTNAWEGKDQELDYLVSAFYPSDTPDQLYTQHIQNVEKIKQDKDWQVQTVSFNRYLAALSDHVRWYLNLKDIAGYQADFASWH